MSLPRCRNHDASRTARLAPHGRFSRTELVRCGVRFGVLHCAHAGCRENVINPAQNPSKPLVTGVVFYGRLV